jgi:glutamate-5-semialdehyde dehydrogenase
MLAIGRQAQAASRQLAALPGAQRQHALVAMAEQLRQVKAELMAANAADLRDAEQAGLTPPLLKRLAVDEKVFNYMSQRLEEVALLPDPVGRILEGHTRPTGLKVEKISVPLGVIGIIYESRPNVTTDAAAVCLKSGNAVILRGGSEALRTNAVLADAMKAAAVASGLPEHAVQLIRTPGHETVGELLQLDEYIDVLIPRGGKGLIRRVAQGTRIPVIKHYEGICHLYLAADAPAEMALALVLNSKCQRVEVCNALEKVLLDANCAARLLPPLVRALADKGVEVRGCERCRQLQPELIPATTDDWSAEYLAPIIAIKIVDGLDAAVQHINHHGSGHTDGIVSQRQDLIGRFVNGVDSASVLVNASTRLSGGGDYGLGAVVGISTDKLHARGPVGCDELTSYKWVAYGNGHLRQ